MLAPFVILAATTIKFKINFQKNKSEAEFVTAEVADHIFFKTNF